MDAVVVGAAVGAAVGVSVRTGAGFWGSGSCDEATSIQRTTSPEE